MIMHIKYIYGLQKTLCLSKLNEWLIGENYKIVSICEQYETAGYFSHICFVGLSVYYYEND